MCADCFNRYHCARACPDRCPAFGAQAAREREPGFRCRVQRLLMAALLHAASERLWSEVTAKKIRGPHGIAVR
jgi:hypothetical protein